ncbi:MAG: tetratricopeptide repeat protein [Wenzhouxiangellaceae bacterium]|nr:tetratricopeptide repeat protein [Wenzhouxiangellaceae bacterium]
MSQPEGWFKQLLARRVPQIVGLFIAATWMTVEIGEWVTERTGLPDALVFHVFLLLVALLPSVAVLAWNHGAPGRDRWPRYEKILVPVNVLAAIAIVGFVIGIAPPGTDGSSISSAEGAIVERTLVDETGEARTFRVAREGYLRRVAAFFWPADGEIEDDWPGYAIAWLLDVHLSRNPLLSVRSPYKLDVIPKLLEAGFPEALGEPLALDLSLARAEQAHLLVRGRWQRSEDGFRLEADVRDVETGAQLAAPVAIGATIFEAVSNLAAELQPVLQSTNELPSEALAAVSLEEVATGSVEALQAFVQGLNLWRMGREFEAAQARLEQAVELDPTFALAWRWLQELRRFNGDFEGSLDAITEALRFDYKLDPATLFLLKANQYAVAGDFDRAMQVLEMWTEVHPNSFEAFALRGQMALNSGELDTARRMFLRADEIDPDNAYIDRFLARAEEAAGDYEAAAARLEAYLAAEPDDVDARMRLGALRARDGQFEAARQAYERARFVTGQDFDPRLGLMRLDARVGDYARALDQMEALRRSAITADQRARLALESVLVLQELGRIEEALDVLARADSDLRQAFAPLLYEQVRSERTAELLIDVGRLDEARELLEAQRESLGPPIGEIMNWYLLQVHLEGRDVEAAEQAVDNLAWFEKNFEFPGATGLLMCARSIVQAMRGDTGSAVETMERGLEALQGTQMVLEPAGQESFELGLARTLIADGRLDRARRLLEDLLRRAPGSGMARLELARNEMRAGRETRARALIEELETQWRMADEDFEPLQEARRIRASIGEA